MQKRWLSLAIVALVVLVALVAGCKGEAPLTDRSALNDSDQSVSIDVRFGKRTAYTFDLPAHSWAELLNAHDDSNGNPDWSVRLVDRTCTVLQSLPMTEVGGEWIFYIAPDGKAQVIAGSVEGHAKTPAAKATRDFWKDYCP